MTYGSWDIEHNRQNVLSFWAIFCSFIPLKTWVPKMKIIWCMISEIWSTTDRIFIILDYLLPIIKYMAREIWSATDRIFLSSWAIFCPFTPLTAQKMKILKNDKTPGDIIIKHKWNKNHDHMLYCSWYMARDRCNCYFSFRAVFCPFVPITAQKIEI